MKPTTKLRHFLLLAGSSLMAISSSYAGQTWDGGSTGPGDSNWNTAANWDGDTLPNFAGVITFAGDTRNSAVNDLAAATTIGGINLTNNGTAGKTNAFTLSGTDITLGGHITTTATTTGPTITDVISLNMAMNAGGKTVTTGLGHDLTISGVISGTVNLFKDGAGTLTLSGANSWSNNLNIIAGTVNINTLLNSGAGNFQSSGIGAALVFNSTNGEAVLNYTGGATTTGKNFVLGNGIGVAGGLYEGNVGRFNNNGSGAVVFSVGSINALQNGVLTTTARTLVLGGANTDANTVGNIRDLGTIGIGGNATVNFRKEDAGTWIFRTNGTYTGTTTVNGGTLQLGNAVDTGGAITASSGITINGGKLLLESATQNNANRITNTIGVSLRGGELSLSGNAAGTIESFGTLGIAGGDSTVTVKGVTAVSRLTGADFSRTANGTALIRGTSLGAVGSLGQITLTSTAGLSFSAGVTLANTANSNTTKNIRIVPYLVGGTTDTDVASTFVTYDTTLGFRALNTTNNFNTNLASANTNVRLTGNTTATSSVAINSLIVANTSATALTINDGQTLTVSSGAILFTNTATIKPSTSTGILAFGSAEGVVTVNDGLTGTISANISGSNGLTKSGAGTLALSGTNGYTGATNVNAGTLLVTGSLVSDVTVSATATVGGGGSVGNLSFAGASLFDLFEAVTNSDSLTATTISFAGTGFGIDNLVSNGAAVDWDTIDNDTYTLITGTLVTTNLDNLGLANAADIGGGRSAYFQNGSLQLVVIPEPGAALLGSLGFLFIFRRRRC